MLEANQRWLGCRVFFDTPFAADGSLHHGTLSCSARYRDVSGPTRFFVPGSRVTWDVMSCLNWKTALLFMGSHLVSWDT